MQGRFCVRSTDGFWLQIDREGRDWYMTGPTPILKAIGNRLVEVEQGATSFFGKQQAATVMERLGLYTAEDPRRLIPKCPPAPWEIVDDPN